MKEYLKKLGSRKFQALLLSLIVNGVTAYFFFTGTLEIDAKVNDLMPMINIIVATISTWVYIFIEGKVDASRKEEPKETLDFLQEE